MREQLLDHIRVDRVVDPGTHLDVARIETPLPCIRRRDHSVRADQLAPVHVVAESRGQQSNTVPALTEYPVGLLEDADARPLEVSGVDADIALVEQDFEPVVEPADHDRAYRAHRLDGLAFRLASAEPALDSFRHR